MKKVITCNNGVKIERNSRWIKIQETTTGRYFFRFRNCRYYLDDCTRTNSPWLPVDFSWNDEDGKMQFISGVINVTFWYSLLVELSDCGEYVRIYECE